MPGDWTLFEEYEVDVALEEGSYRVGIFTGFGIAQGPEGT